MLEAPPQLRREDVPRSLAALLARTMSKRPEDRPQSAAELGQELQRVQGELGLGMTPLPLASTPPPRPGPAAATRQGAAAVPPPAGVVPPPAPVLGPATRPPARPGTVPPPPVVEIRSVGGAPVDDDDEAHGHTHTVTVGRSAQQVAEDDTAPRDAHTTRRVVLGTVAAVVCLLAVAVSLLVFGRDEAAAPDDTAPIATQVVDIPPPAPQNVTVAAAAAENQVVVAWQAVGDGAVEMRYQVQPETTSMQPQRTTALSVTFEVAPGTKPCFTVVAINPVGRISEKSPLACL